MHLFRDIAMSSGGEGSRDTPPYGYKSCYVWRSGWESASESQDDAE